MPNVLTDCLSSPHYHSTDSSLKNISTIIEHADIDDIQISREIYVKLFDLLCHADETVHEQMDSHTVHTARPLNITHIERYLECAIQHKLIDLFIKLLMHSVIHSSIH